VLGACVVAGVLLLQLGTPLGLVGALEAVGLGTALVRLGGTPVVELAGPAWRWARRRGGGRGTWMAPLVPLNITPARTPALPPPLAGQVFLAVAADVAGTGARVTDPDVAAGDGAVPGSAGIGGGEGPQTAVVHDTVAGTYAATLRVSGRQFALVERGDQDALLALWGSALAPLCTEAGAVVALRWSEWAAPAGMEEQHAYLAEHGIDDPADPAVVSYRRLLRSSAPVATRHEVLVTVVVAAARVRVGARHRGDRRQAAVEVLLEELSQLRRRLERAGLAVSAPLSPPELARTLRVRLDPSVIPTLDRRGRSLGDRAGLVAPADAGPLAARAEWSHWQVDASVHRAFWFREWPRTDVGPTWLEDLLLYSGAVRTVAVCYEPVAPRRSAQTIGRHAAKLESDAEHRRRTGFRVGAHHRRASRAVEEREEELVAGFVEFEYVGLVDVAASGTEELERACGEVVQAAAACGIELRALDGRHEMGTSACLPLARGLAPRAVRL